MRAGFVELRQSMFRMNITLVGATIALIAAVLARGA